MGRRWLWLGIGHILRPSRSYAFSMPVGYGKQKLLEAGYVFVQDQKMIETRYDQMEYMTIRFKELRFELSRRGTADIMVLIYWSRESEQR